MNWDEYRAYLRAMESPDPKDRPVPELSGEGAIYTPEYLARKEGNANGVDPRAWRNII